MGDVPGKHVAGSPGEQEFDLVVVGAGLSGLACALGAALKGHRVSLLETADKVGGAAAYSGGQVWVGANHVAAREGIEDDLESTEAYIRGSAHAHPELLDEDAMRRWIQAAPTAIRYWEEVGAIEWVLIPGFADYHQESPGARLAGRYLTGARFDGSRLGEWRERLQVSPHFPIGTTYDEMFLAGRRGSEVAGERGGFADPLTFGTGVVAAFFRRVLEEESIELLLEHRVVELLEEDGRVVGVRAEGPQGELVRRGEVVLATSSYDWDPEMVQEYLGLGPDDFGSAAPQSVSGDGIRLARSVGGDVAQIPANCVPLLPGWPSDSYPGFKYGPEFALPHSFTVDSSGRRFCDDSFWLDIVRKALDPDDRHIPCFLIWDERHHQSYGLGATPPGGDYPADLVKSAPDLRSLAAALGIPGDTLEETAERFNASADAGEDPEWGRGTNPFVRRYTGDPTHEPNPLLGSVAEPPFHGMRLRLLGTGIGSTGIRTDGEGRVLDAQGRPVPGLTAIGACAAMLSSGTGYNSGFALGRGLTLAYLVAERLHALSGKPAGASA
jgi:3-oxosteroid 1-dehydrogenase